VSILRVALMSKIQGRAQESLSENVRVWLRQKWIDVPLPTSTTSVVRLNGGVVVREKYSKSTTVHGVFRIWASKAVARAREADAVHVELLALMEDLRLVWHFAGGYPIRTRAFSNHQKIRKRLFEREHGHPPLSSALHMQISIVGAYQKMPLRDAVSLLRGLARLPGSEGESDEHKLVLWTCLKAFYAATVAEGPIERFIRAFPALDLLASTHYGRPELSAGTKRALQDIRHFLTRRRAQLGQRALEVLRGGLKVAALQDKFEAFVMTRLPQEARLLSDSFRKYNRLRNDVFHKARFDAIDAAAAEATRQLLEQCLRAELRGILEKARMD
jgi:hypothetical protein